MSEEHLFFVSSDGSQITLDQRTGKYCTMLSNNQARNNHPRYQSLNRDGHQMYNSIPAHQDDQNNCRESQYRANNFASNLIPPYTQNGTQQQIVNYQQEQNINHNTTSTWQNSEHNCILIDKEQCDPQRMWPQRAEISNSTISKQSSTSNRVQEPQTNVNNEINNNLTGRGTYQDNKRMLNDSDNFITVGANKG